MERGWGSPSVIQPSFLLLTTQGKKQDCTLILSNWIFIGLPV